MAGTALPGGGYNVCGRSVSGGQFVRTSSRSGCCRSARKGLCSRSKGVQSAPASRAGNITALVGHYNERRRQCLVEISSEKDENGGKSYYDEVVDPKTDHFIAARSRTVGERGPHDDDTVITGAPVPLKDEAGAQSWFNGLIK
jgi:hypothetical protein